MDIRMVRFCRSKDLVKRRFSSWALTPDHLIRAALVPIFATPSWILDGIFAGAVRARDRQNGLIASFMFCGLVLAMILQNHGLWLA